MDSKKLDLDKEVQNTPLQDFDQDQDINPFNVMSYLQQKRYVPTFFKNNPQGDDVQNYLNACCYKIWQIRAAQIVAAAA